MKYSGTTAFPKGLAISDYELRNAALLKKRAAVEAQYGAGHWQAQVADDMASFDWTYEVAA